ncbi:hypothetical protein HMPREF0623_0834 [Pediococcus acidilactici DSM 20284]|uniref:Uncharacterized protein n=1 Tax=Pediococcus acidilactici DSM 20284 TaxID=862514 RepID=E0NFA4_PEDAC|nr:hypothetical protein HMPREF0623_0834 [Pediococcus acidilactici DSM 20284]
MLHVFYRAFGKSTVKFNLNNRYLKWLRLTGRFCNLSQILS